MATTQRFSQFEAGSREYSPHGNVLLPCRDLLQEDLRTLAEKKGAGVARHSQVCAPAPYALLAVDASPSLLQVSDDTCLANSRGGLLRSIGFDVMHVTGAEAIQDIGSKRVCALLICQTIQAGTARLIRQRFNHGGVGPRAIRVLGQTQPEPEEYDLLMRSPVPPATFVHEMTKVYNAVKTSTALEWVSQLRRSQYPAIRRTE